MKRQQMTVKYHGTNNIKEMLKIELRETKYEVRFSLRLREID